ncbi:hypothetical protein AYI68_g981 [Smittium mucronatum]|uniref:Uncharacterized protein n=1 Tax=Smittium mucronatum TaxID=133383 RepID=A0A1R0H6P4_9FUNG|nr:hypothetical protein AYI68_g981 [Smittium mucronatum]
MFHSTKCFHAFLIIFSSFVLSQEYVTPQQQCVASKCNNDNGNVNCVAACYGVPSPDSSAISKTNECHAECIKASSDASAQAICNASCVSRYYNPNEKNIPSTASSPTQSGPQGPPQQPRPPMGPTPQSPSQYGPPPPKPQTPTPPPAAQPPSTNNYGAPQPPSSGPGMQYPPPGGMGAPPPGANSIGKTSGPASSPAGSNESSQNSNTSASAAPGDKGTLSLADKFGEYLPDIYDNPGSNSSDMNSGFGNNSRSSGYGNYIDSASSYSVKNSLSILGGIIIVLYLL